MQGEVAHRYMLGLYEFLEKLTTNYPTFILFESCSGGGGRFECQVSCITCHKLGRATIPMPWLV